MSDRLLNVAKAALALPKDERIELIVRLLDSIDEQPSDADQGVIDAAWVKEADRRYQAYKRGEMKGVPIEEVHDMVRAQQPRRTCVGSSR